MPFVNVWENWKIIICEEGDVFLLKNFNKQKQEYAMKKDLKCDPCDKVYVNQQLWIPMNACNTKLYVFNAQGVALICQCWQCGSNFSTAASREDCTWRTKYPMQHLWQYNASQGKFGSTSQIQTWRYQIVMPNVLVQICSWKFNDVTHTKKRSWE